MTKKPTPGRGTPLFELHVAESRPRVLLAEDDDEMRALLVAGLRSDGFDVLEARDGAELLERLGDLFSEAGGDEGVDLVISDIKMPFFDGLSVLAGLRRNSVKTPVILITAFGDQDTHDKARSLGASAVFDKPFDLNDLRTSALHFARVRAA